MSQRQRLDSWKLIAGHLGRSVRTVQRWEAEEGLPVLRLNHEQRGSVYAYVDELDAWWKGRSESSAVETAPARKFPWWIVAAAGTTLLFGLFGVVILDSRKATNPAQLPVPLTTFPEFESHPAFSPDGNRFAFTWNSVPGNADIFTKAVESPEVKRLTTHPATDFGPAWSPDGKRIAFVRQTGSELGEVILVPAEGGAEMSLGEFSGMTQGNLKVPPRHLGWTPDSRYLMITSRENPEGPLRLFRVDSMDGTRVPVMEPQSGILGDSGPAVSPDGKTLAFHRFRAMGSGGIYTVGLDEAYLGRGKVRTLVSGNFAASPVWLSNRELAFYGYRQGEMQIFRVPADGSSEAVPILGGLQGMELSYSISKQRLAFKRLEVDDDIWRLPLQGDGVAAGPAAAWILSSRQEAVPEYSPDGTLVAFISNRAGYPNVWICERNGSHPRQLTRLAGSITGPMSWSPDGKRIAFASNTEGSGDVYVIAADGAGAPRRLTQDPLDDVRASWSKDGKWIFFGSNRTGRYEVWKIAPEGGQALQVTTTGGSSPLESPDGKWLYYTGDDQYETVLWRRPATGGAAEKVVERMNLWYSVGRSGIYYFGRKRKEVRYWDAVTRQDRVLAELPTGTGLGIAAAPDGRELAISMTNSRSSDILMIERFR